MSILEIRSLGDPVLRQRARHLEPAELARPEIQRLIDDLVETLHAARGAGLAAPQVGEPLAICAVHIADNPRYPYKPNHPLTILVNPVIEPPAEIDESAEELIYEGCLSVPDLRGVVRRRMHVRVGALDRAGRPFTVEAHGLTAGTYQHEIDHLHGRLFVDAVEDPTTLTTWANFDRFHRAAFVARAEAIVRRHGG